MAVEPLRREVDGKVYEFSEYGAEASIDMLARLTALMGEPTLMLIAAGMKNFVAGNKLAGKDVDNELIHKAVQGLVANMAKSKELKDIIKKLTTEGVICDHEKIVFDAHFAGSGGLAHLSRVVRAVLEAHYGDFFSALFASVSS